MDMVDTKIIKVYLSLSYNSHMINLLLLSQVIEVDKGGSLLDCTQELNLMPGFNLEGFPNRDSTLYTTEYGIESAKTCIRGTLRYKVRDEWIVSGFMALSAA